MIMMIRTKMQTMMMTTMMRMKTKAGSTKNRAGSHKVSRACQWLPTWSLSVRGTTESSASLSSLRLVRGVSTLWVSSSSTKSTRCFLCPIRTFCWNSRAGRLLLYSQTGASCSKRTEYSSTLRQIRGLWESHRSLEGIRQYYSNKYMVMKRTRRDT